MTLNDLVEKMAKRAGELANQPMDFLRRSYPETTETDAELIKLCKEMKYTRGDMIYAILSEEFNEEFDKEIEE
jgi:hypothetical protein